MSNISTAFEIIRSVTQTMLESQSSQPALDAIVRLISEKMEVDVCSIYLNRPQTGLLHLTSNCGLHSDSIQDISMQTDEGLTGAVFSSGDVINIAHPSKDKRFKYFPSLGEERLQNFLGIAIPPSSKKCLGVLTLQSTDDRPFDSTVEDLVFTLAAQLGTLLENHSLKSHGKIPSEEPKNIIAPAFVRAQVAFGGIAAGPVSTLQTHQIWDTILFSECLDPKEELAVFHKAVELARKESQWLKSKAGELFAEMDAKIFAVHEWMLSDPLLISPIENHIRERMSAFFAVKLATRELAKSFADSGNAQLISKIADVRDVGLRIVNSLNDVKDKRSSWEDTQEGSIVVAVELLPSDLVYLQTKKILGVLCESGGVTSHAAILARSLGIPCFIGLPGLTNYLHNGMPVIMDANSGLLFINPDIHVEREYKRLMEDLETKQLMVPSHTSITRDGVQIQLSANVSLLSDFAIMEQSGIQEVGLYRTEFFFMIRNQMPDEQAQFELYSKILEHSAEHGATIRLLDVGGDKPLRYFDWGKEENPYLGWRSIRMLLARPEIMKPHLRALLRASQTGKMKILIPMISLVKEIQLIKNAFEEVRIDLENQYGVPFMLPPLGAMIEIPSAVIQIKKILNELDFICIGTNDLIQYLFAVDRGNERVADYYQPYHPALWIALKQIADAAHETNKSVTICGEMASDPHTLPLLLGLGITRLSIAPASADAVRAGLLPLRVSACKQLIEKILDYNASEQIRGEVDRFLLENK